MSLREIEGNPLQGRFSSTDALCWGSIRVVWSTCNVLKCCSERAGSSSYSSCRSHPSWSTCISQSTRTWGRSSTGNVRTGSATRGSARTSWRTTTRSRRWGRRRRRPEGWWSSRRTATVWRTPHSKNRCRSNWRCTRWRFYRRCTKTSLTHPSAGGSDGGTRRTRSVGSCPCIGKCPGTGYSPNSGPGSGTTAKRTTPGIGNTSGTTERTRPWRSLTLDKRVCKRVCNYFGWTTRPSPSGRMTKTSSTYACTYKRPSECRCGRRTKSHRGSSRSSRCADSYPSMSTGPVWFGRTCNPIGSGTRTRTTTTSRRPRETNVSTTYYRNPSTCSSNSATNVRRHTRRTTWGGTWGSRYETPHSWTLCERPRTKGEHFRDASETYCRTPWAWRTCLCVCYVGHKCPGVFRRSSRASSNGSIGTDTGVCADGSETLGLRRDRRVLFLKKKIRVLDLLR